MAVLVLVYRWLSWCRIAIGNDWDQTESAEQAVLCAMLACNLTVGNMRFADGHESLNQD